ncbi:MAG: cobaltochelatase subunit CobN [Pyrinomonadaceae bacterium]
MKVTALYVGSSLLAPLRQAERDINRDHQLDLSIAAHNFGAPLTDDEWQRVDQDLGQTDVVFVIHVMDGENAARLLPLLDRYQSRHHAVIVINCMPELMRRTRMGKLDIEQVLRKFSREGANKESGRREEGTPTAAKENGGAATRLLATAGSWIGSQARAHRSGNGSKNGHGQYLKLVDRLPLILRFIPSAGKLRDVKNYLYIFCYFLQPTPANIRAMVLFALKHYVPDQRLKKVTIAPPETMPSVAVYHPDAAALFQSFAEYRKWYGNGRQKARGTKQNFGGDPLDPKTTIGLLLMRPQVVSNTRKHYDGLIRAIEAEGLSVIPAISTLMDNREACRKFFIEPTSKGQKSKPQIRARTGEQGTPAKTGTTNNEQLTAADKLKSRVSQIVSLTGFSFVGGPAMNDSVAAAEFLQELNVPFRSAVSLDIQTIEAWRASGTGLNPIQAGMQIAIPEIDGATEPFVYGGMPAASFEPVPLADRCQRFARRLKNWNRLQTAKRADLKLALIIYCFPPNKGNIGTAADLDVFASLHETLLQLEDDGYTVTVPATAAALRDLMLSHQAEEFGATANVAYRMSAEEYTRLCPYAAEVEHEWGPPPGVINSFGDDLLIQGVTLGNAFIGLQPTFGYEGDPMRLLMAQSGAPHHGFMAFYTYLQKVFHADAVIHVGTHGALEFMPGKQVGLSDECWPDRLIGELPNLYIYSVNNPSEGTIAKRRSYAELISYLTPPIENAGLYKELASLKEMLLAYRQTTDDQERDRLFGSIEECSRGLNFVSARVGAGTPSA